MITLEYPMALANPLITIAPNASFCLLSGQGADRTEKSKIV